MGAKPPKNRRIAILLPPGAEILDVTGPLSAFSAANRILRTQHPAAPDAYSLELIGERVGPVPLEGGIHMCATASWMRARDGVHTLLIPGAADISPMLDARVIRWIQRMSERTSRLVSVCTGALVLAEAGLLDGRSATTHWESAHKLQAYNNITVRPDDIYVRDENIWTSAGISAGIDLAIALIEEDHSRTVAQAVARELVVFLRRPGGQAQYSAHLLAQSEEADELEDLLNWALDNLTEDLTVEALAERAGISERHLRRIFTQRRGISPSEFLERARVDAARRLLESPEASLKQVARDTGFGTVERLRRACTRQLGVLPSDYQRRNGHTSSAT